jgi:hypothetical protein
MAVSNAVGYNNVLFIVYLTALALTETRQRRRIGVWWVMNRKGCAGRQSWHRKLRCYSGVCLEGPSKTKSQSVVSSRYPGRVSNRAPPECYCLSQLCRCNHCHQLPSVTYSRLATKVIHVFNGTRSFITVFTRTHHFEAAESNPHVHIIFLYDPF